MSQTLVRTHVPSPLRGGAQDHGTAFNTWARKDLDGWTRPRRVRLAEQPLVDPDDDSPSEPSIFDQLLEEELREEAREDLAGDGIALPHRSQSAALEAAPPAPVFAPELRLPSRAELENTAAEPDSEEDPGFTGSLLLPEHVGLPEHRGRKLGFGPWIDEVEAHSASDRGSFWSAFSPV